MSLQLLQERTCLDNLPVCGASCCKSMTFKMNGYTADVQQGATLRIKIPLTDDLRFYYRLHGVGTTRDHVIIKLNEFKLNGDILTVYRRCDWLTEDLRCKGHPYKKPRTCQGLNWETAQQKRFHLTEGCMFKEVIS